MMKYRFVAPPKGVMAFFLLLCILPAIGCKHKKKGRISTGGYLKDKETRKKRASPSPVLAKPKKIEGPKGIRFFYTDLDGTLLSSNQRISKKNIQALRAFQNRGGLVGVATGRIPSSGWRYAIQINADLPLVFANGAIIMDRKGKVIQIKYITRVKEIREICSLIKQHGCRSFYTAMVNRKTHKIRYYQQRCKAPAAGTGILKLRARRCRLHDRLFQLLKKRYGRLFSIIEAGSGSYKGLSIAASGVDKGIALRFIAKLLKSKMEYMAFIGDGGNDIGGVKMLHGNGGKCFVMKNGTAALKAACPRHLSADHNHHGVAEALKGIMGKIK